MCALAKYEGKMIESIQPDITSLIMKTKEMLEFISNVGWILSIQIVSFHIYLRFPDTNHGVPNPIYNVAII